MSSGYATVSIDDVADGPPARNSFTDALGCTETTVDGHRLAAADGVPLPRSPETLCVPIDADGPIRLVVDGATVDGTGEAGAVDCPPSGVARVPAGVGCRLHAPAGASVVAVGAPAEPAPGERPTVVDLEGCSFPQPSTSTIGTARLTAPLGATGMKVNARILEAGEHVPYHTEGDQEELFVPVRGPATMRIDGERVETPVGTVTRVAPPVPRSAANEGDEAARWLMVGAPPTGDPDGWDPGAVILE